MLTITNQQARRVILSLQGLADPPRLRLGLNGLHDLIKRLGYVQVDSIQWVERAQHMILYARNQTYRPKHLKHLLETDRTLFENWTHDASVIPTNFYPYWRHKFDRDKSRILSRFTNWQGEGYISKCNDLMEKIETGGPLRSRDLKPPDSGPQEMWQWHDGKTALEFLWRTGRLCISGREGFQKRYDLARNGVCAEHFDLRVSEEEFIDWACRSALERLGFGTAGDIARFWDLVSIKEANQWLERQDSKTVIQVKVAGMQKGDEKTHYARCDIVDLIKTLDEPPKRLRVLSPFDPVIRNRKRLEWLFGFDYRIEIYVPEHKRKWGYYVFPLLEGDRLIGRIDMRAQRKDETLEVKKLWYEPKIKPSAARQSRLDSELQRQARLAGVKQVVWLEGAFLN